LKATRAITAGSEVYVPYGGGYWDPASDQASSSDEEEDGMDRKHTAPEDKKTKKKKKQPKKRLPPLEESDEEDDGSVVGFLETMVPKRKPKKPRSTEKLFDKTEIQDPGPEPEPDLLADESDDTEVPLDNLDLEINRLLRKSFDRDPDSILTWKKLKGELQLLFSPEFVQEKKEYIKKKAREIAWTLADVTSGNTDSEYDDDDDEYIDVAGEKSEEDMDEDGFTPPTAEEMAELDKYFKKHAPLLDEGVDYFGGLAQGSPPDEEDEDSVVEIEKKLSQSPTEAIEEKMGASSSVTGGVGGWALPDDGALDDSDALELVSSGKYTGDTRSPELKKKRKEKRDKRGLLMYPFSKKEKNCPRGKVLSYKGKEYYTEGQHKQQCLKHAVNMVLGSCALTSRDMLLMSQVAAKQQFPEATKEELRREARAFGGLNGPYDAFPLYSFLQNHKDKDIKVLLGSDHLLDRLLREAKENPGVVELLLNVQRPKPEGSTKKDRLGKHWIAIKDGLIFEPLEFTRASGEPIPIPEDFKLPSDQMNYSDIVGAIIVRGTPSMKEWGLSPHRMPSIASASMASSDVLPPDSWFESKDGEKYTRETWLAERREREKKRLERGPSPLVERKRKRLKRSVKAPSYYVSKLWPVYVDKPSIAGDDEFGLFASKLINKNDIVVEYDGEIISRDAANARSKAGTAQHIRGLDYDTKISGIKEPLPGRGWGSLANTTKQRTDINVNWYSPPTRSHLNKLKDTRTGAASLTRMFLKAKRDIQKGEEILVSYGKRASKRDHSRITDPDASHGPGEAVSESKWMEEEDLLR
jgi:hypothetical protein